MKLPLLVLLLFVVAGGIPAWAASPPAATASTRKAAPYETVRTASRFSIGRVEEAGVIAPAETALRALLQEKDALKQCQALIEEGTPAGKLYGLFGIRLLDREAYQTALPPFLKDRTKVSYMSGCIVSDFPVSEIAKLINSGKIK